MGAIVRTEMPFDSAEVSLGFAFIEFERRAGGEHAEHRRPRRRQGARLQGRALPAGQAHRRHADEYVKPEFRLYAERARCTRVSRTRTRPVCRGATSTSTAAYCSVGAARAAPVYGGEREKGTGVNSSHVAWSSQGTYLATFHNKGIAIWAGDAFEKIGVYAHKGVKVVIFSPGEATSSRTP